jgi:hypothetical protein
MFSLSRPPLVVVPHAVNAVESVGRDEAHKKKREDFVVPRLRDDANRMDALTKSERYY